MEHQRKFAGSAQWARVCYGVDLHNGNQTVVRAVKTRAGLSYTTLRPDDRSYPAEVEKGKAVTAGCMSERESLTRWLTAPFSSAGKARRIFPSLLDIQLPFPLEDCVYDFLLTGKTPERSVRALAVAAQSAIVEKRIDVYRSRGMDPVVLDQEGIALWTQSLCERPALEGVTRVVVYLCGACAAMAVGNGDELISAHAVSGGSGQIDRILCAQINGAPAAMEWAWAGPDAKNKDAVDTLYAELSRKWHGESFIHKEPETFLARALGTRALSAGLLRCNLRIGALEHPLLAARRKKRSADTALLLLAAGLLLCGISLACDTLSGRKLENARTAFASKADELAGYHVTQRGKDALERVEQALKRRSELSQPFVDSFGPSLTGTLKAIMNAGKENSLAYEIVLLRGGSVTVVGTSGAWDQCERLSRYLKKLGFSVKLDRRESSSDGKIRFWIVPGGGGE